MKNRIYLSLFAIGLALSSCSDETLGTSQVQDGNLVITATIDGNNIDTRTLIYNEADGSTLFWSPGDAIGVNSESAKNVKFTSINASRTVAANFLGAIEGTPVNAYYPYSDVVGDGLENNKLTITLPDVIKFESNPEAETASPTSIMSTNGPMVSTQYTSQENGGSFAFKHICGLMRIAISSIPANATSLVISADQNIAGTGTIEDITTNASLTPPTIGSKTVTITLPKTTTYGEKIFYVPLPVATYSKLTVELKKEDGSAILTKSISDLSVACGQLVDMNKLIGLELKPSEVKEAVVNLKYGEVVDIIIKDVTAQDATIEFPTYNEGGERSVNLLFAEKPTTKVTIKGDGISISNLNVKLLGSQEYDGSAWTSIPEWSNAATAPDFDITLPGATNITLDSDNEKVAQYGNVSLAGGGNSYIGSQLKGNITVNSLTVQAGTNINVTGLVGQITISNDNSNTKNVFLKNGSNVKKSGYCYEFYNLSEHTVTYKNLLAWDGTSRLEPQKDNSGCYLIRSAAELARFQGTLEAAKKAAVTATMTASAKLCCDINMDSKPLKGIVLGAGCTFDGQNHTISNLTINDYMLNEDSEYTDPACAGLFSTTLDNSVVTGVKLKTVKITTEAKWLGALIGHSYSKEISGCNVEEVTINGSTTNNTFNAFRIGGLIGYMDKNTVTDAQVTDCSVTNATLTGCYGIGGLVGATMYAQNITFTNCKTSAITIKMDQTAMSALQKHEVENNHQSEDYIQNYIGYMSKMIGDAFTASGSTLTFTNCTPDTEFTSEEGDGFWYNNSYTGYSSGQDFCVKGSQYVGKVDKNPTIIVGNKAWIKSTDYHVFTEHAAR